MFSDNDNLKRTIKEEEPIKITGLGDYLDFIGGLSLNDYDIDDIFDMAEEGTIGKYFDFYEKDVY